MAKVPGMVETENVVGKQTLVGRVSNMLKDGSYSGPPMLFRHASMQRIRHCCQNLNLFPYLLYSFDNSKSHPIARKVHLRFGQLLQSIAARILCLFRSFRQSLVQDIRPDESQTQESTQPKKSCKSTRKFRTVDPQKRKQHPIGLIIAVYFAPMLLIFQSIGLFSIMVFDKYTPGFIFLIAALLILGGIWLKILFHESVTYSPKHEKNKDQ
ncbi:uncharacterized protein LOC143351725 isoform X1 [Colletes latitarsis]|uniref:uncharacterized protein LOC143351725 isoform X1 n=2 Tax=Colletes latitarsis TaxID=2605962 RepID=UPI004035D4ED